MSSATKTLSLVHPDDIGKVDFHWNEDRFEHSIRIRQSSVQCRSGSEKDTWPVSPPIQQLSIESIAGREVALGVGCAGSSHWSLSVESTEDGFRFDWACRTKATPDRLGTTYPDEGTIEFDLQGQASKSSAAGDVRLGPTQPLTGAGTYRWCYTVCPAG